MQTVMTQTKPRKSSMMERLRRLHSGLKAADSNNTTTTTTTTKSNSRRPLSFIFTIHPTTHKPVVAQQQYRPAFSATSKTRSRHNEYALDLEQLDSKLEQLALSDRDSVEEHVNSVDDIIVEPQFNAQNEQDSKTRGTVSRQTASDIEIIVHPPAEEAAAAGGSEDGSHEAELPQPHVSDFDIFLQQAAEDERRRAASKPKSHREQQPQLNQFYSNNWADSSSPPTSSKPKLAEIHEDEDSDEKINHHEANVNTNGALCSEKKEQEQEQQSQQSQQQTCASRGLAILSSATTRSLSPDLADTPGRRPVHTQTWPGVPVARHVSFQEPIKAIRGRTRSNPNLYHAARCAESPQGRRAFARRKSIRRAITDYVRQLA